MSIPATTPSQGAHIQARLMSIKQATATLGIGRTLAYELIGLGKLKTVRIGRRRFVPLDAIESFIATLRD
jgi:excisionase family DNA binding protein